MENLKEIEALQDKNLKLGKQVELLQLACREAAAKIKKLEARIELLSNPVDSFRKGGL